MKASTLCKSISNNMSSKNTALRATCSYQNPAFESEKNAEKAKHRRASSQNDYRTLHEEIPEKTLSTPTAHVSIPIPESTVPIIHREIKSGRQRFRWNLLFNALVWIICPLPLWLPFVSNGLAIYLLPSIEIVFALIWLTISLLAARNAFLLFQ